MKVEISILKNLAPGDHVWAERDWGWWSHHGIYVDDDTIIHRVRGEGVTWTTVKKFRNGEVLRIKDYGSQDKLFAPIGVAERAIDRLGEKGYDLTDRNCEHFATWCVTGKSLSQQVKEIWLCDGRDRNYDKKHFVDLVA